MKADSPAVLTSFHTMANTQSRYKYLTGIENDIEQEHYAVAETKLAYAIELYEQCGQRRRNRGCNG